MPLFPEIVGDDHSYCLPPTSYTRKIVTLQTDLQSKKLGLTLQQSQVEGNFLPLKVKNVEPDGPACTAGLKIGDLVYLDMKSNNKEEVELEVISSNIDTDDTALQPNQCQSDMQQSSSETSDKNKSTGEEMSHTDLTDQQDMLNWNCSSLPNMSYDLTKKTLRLWNPEADVVSDCILVYYQGQEHHQLLAQPSVNVCDTSGEVREALRAYKGGKKANTPFKCRFCEKSFSLKCEWKLHARQKICSNEKNYQTNGENKNTKDEIECFDIDNGDNEYEPPSKKSKTVLGSNTQSYLTQETKLKFTKMSLNEQFNYLGKIQFEFDLKKEQLIRKKDEIKQIKQSITKEKEKSPASSKTISNASKCPDSMEKPGADYTRLMPKHTLELLEKQSNEENINLIGKLEFELGVTEQRNSKLISTVTDLENQVKRLKKENDLLQEKKLVEVGVICHTCKDFEGASVAARTKQVLKPIIQRKVNTISFLTNKLYNLPNFNGVALEQEINSLEREGSDFHDKEAFAEVKRRNALLKENRDLKQRLKELTRLFLAKTQTYRKTEIKTVSKPKTTTYVTKAQAASIVARTWDRDIIRKIHTGDTANMPRTDFHRPGAPKTPKLTVTTVDQEGAESHQTFIKPVIALSTLAILAIMNSKDGISKLTEIYEFISEHFPYYQYTKKNQWKKFVKLKLNHRLVFIKNIIDTI